MSEKKPNTVNNIVEQDDNEVKEVEDNDSNLIAVPVETFPSNTPLPCTVYIRIGDKYPLFRRQGERLTAQRLIALQKKGASVLYLHKMVWRIFMQELESQMPSDSKERILHIRNLLVAYGQELEKKMREPKKPMFQKLQKLSEALAASIRQQPSLGTQLLRKYSDVSVQFVNHSVNVAIYSAVISYKMGYSFEDMKTITYAALVHDIGELFIPKTILYKRSELTADEKETMTTHARKGAELLQTVGAPIPVVAVAHQHHERMDGKGYPTGIGESKIHPFAKIVSIADTYDSLTSQKPYREAISPKAAIEKMRSFTGQFDSQIINMVGGAETTPAPTPMDIPPDEPAASNDTPEAQKKAS